MPTDQFKTFILDRLASNPTDGASTDGTGDHFSAFNPKHMKRVHAVVDQLKAAAEGGDLDAVVAVAEAAQKNEPIAGLVRYALEIFVTHYPPARAAVKLPALEQRQPGLFYGSQKKGPGMALFGGGGASGDERKVDFWREDPLVNEHHWHWHVVYPWSGRMDGQLGDRHGELFAYMHQQMLARYDAERLAVGLPRVTPFSEYTTTIPQGYDPGSLRLWTEGQTDYVWFLFRPRADNHPGNPAQGQSLKDVQTWLTNQIDADAFPDINDLADLAEANLRGDPKPNSHLHNFGHGFLASMSVQRAGVMNSTITALRDPIFWRWHKMIDTLFERWQERQKPEDLHDDVTAEIRDIDIIVCGEQGRPQDDASVDATVQALAGQWDDDLRSATIVGDVKSSNTLTTSVKSRPILKQGGTEPVFYADHEDFAYLLRINNPEADKQTVTVRIFLAPTSEQADRYSWIEMDRFRFELEPGKNVIYRPSEMASVVKKPALKSSDLTSADGAVPQPQDSSSWCDCGWPYTMMLPTGTQAGMPFQLLVMLSRGTDITKDEDLSHCVSMSYCGLQDDVYPDKRNMGYPFSRKFADTIANTIAARSNMAVTDLTIKCTTAKPA